LGRPTATAQPWPTPTGPAPSSLRSPASRGRRLIGHCLHRPRALPAAIPPMPSSSAWRDQARPHTPSPFPSPSPARRVTPTPLLPPIFPCPTEKPQRASCFPLPMPMGHTLHPILCLSSFLRAGMSQFVLPRRLNMHVHQKLFILRVLPTLQSCQVQRLHSH
jgi:hypothetical protein